MQYHSLVDKFGAVQKPCSSMGILLCCTRAQSIMHINVFFFFFYYLKKSVGVRGYLKGWDMNRCPCTRLPICSLPPNLNSSARLASAPQLLTHERSNITTFPKAWTLVASSANSWVTVGVFIFQIPYNSHGFQWELNAGWTDTSSVVVWFSRLG